jgi:hypothetical protein
MARFSSAILHAGMRTQRQRADIPQPTIREQFVEKGCDGEFLDELLKYYRRRENESRGIQEELEALHRRAINLASDIEQAGVKQRGIFSRKSLNQVALPLRTSAIHSEAANLKKAGEMVGRLAIRKDTRGEMVNMIYKYCRYATAEGRTSAPGRRNAITHRDIADLICEATSDSSDELVTEEAVRQAVKRHKLSADDEWFSAHNLAGAAMRKDKVLDLIRRKLRKNDANKA